MFSLVRSQFFFSVYYSDSYNIIQLLISKKYFSLMQLREESWAGEIAEGILTT